MFPVKDEPDKKTEAGGAENEEVRERKRKPTNDNETNRNDGANLRPGNIDRAERIARLTANSLLPLRGFIVGEHSELPHTI
jgi:hypothetical protein